MNLTKLLDRIAGKQHERQQSRHADYRKLIGQIADGKDPDTGFVDHVLTDNQKTIDDLRQAVELLLHRRELRATWEKAATMAKDRDGIEQQIAEADQLLEQAEFQHEETTAPLYARIEAIKQASTAADRARRELWETCAYPELKDRLGQVSNRFRDLDAQRAEIESRAADIRRFAEGDRQEIRFVANKAQEEELSERADRYEKSAKKLEAEAAALRPEINKLQQEEKWIRNQMLEP